MTRNEEENGNYEMNRKKKSEEIKRKMKNLLK